MDAPDEKHSEARDKKSKAGKSVFAENDDTINSNSQSVAADSESSHLIAWGPWWQFGLLWFALTVGVALFSPNFVWPKDTSDAGSVPFGSDFLQEWIGGSVLSGEHADRLYDRPYFKLQQHNSQLIGFTWDDERLFPPVYPPSHYTLFIPLSQIPYRVAVYVWLVISMGTFWLVCIGADKIALLVHSVDPNHDTISRPRQIHRVWCLGLLFPPLLATMTMGQKGIVFLAICTLATLAWKLNQRFVSGLLLGMLTVKPTLLIFVPVFFLWHRAWSVLAGTLTTVFALIALAAIICPANVWQDYLQFAIQAGSYQQTAGYHSSWSASIMSVVSILPESNGVLKLGAWVTTFGLGCIALKNCRTQINATARTIYTIAIFSTLLSPHFFFYDLVLFLLPLRLMFEAEKIRAILHGILIAAAAYIAQHAEIDFSLLPFVFMLLAIDLRFGPPLDKAGSR